MQIDKSSVSAHSQNFFVQSDSYIILSLMEHKITGRNYLMVVNKYMNAPQTIGLRFTDVGSLSEVNQTTGNLTPIGNEYKNGVFTRTLDAGAAVLLALPEGVSFVTPKRSKKVQICLKMHMFCFWIHEAAVVGL